MMNGFFVSITNNLLEDKHFERMGNAVWLYMWLIDRMTEISEGQGIVNGGYPITHAMVQHNFKTMNDRQYRRYLKILKDAGYINTLKAQHGLYVTINKAKKNFGKRAVKPAVKSRPDKNDRTENIQTGQKVSSVRTKLTARPDKNDLTLYIDNNTNTNNNTNNNIGDASPDAKETIKKLYYECIKAYKLPVLNHNTLRAKINAMVQEDEPDAIIKYLTFMRYQYQRVQMSYKPRISNGLDFYTKRVQIREAIQDEVKSQQSNTAWRPKSKKGAK